MALPTSGPLTLSDIQGEFGGSNPISLSEYYAGGGLVPSGTSGTNGPVPTSGTISISNFYGTSNTPTLEVGAGDVSGTSSGLSSSGLVVSSTSPDTTAIGGTPPYTYAWTHISTSGGTTPNINSSTTQNPSWSVIVDAGDPSVSVWRVTVTDSAAATAHTDITVTLTWIDIS